MTIPATVQPWRLAAVEVEPPPVIVTVLDSG
jgi:hypothetical protein